MLIAFIIDSIGSGGAQRLLINTAKGLSKKYKTKIILYNQISNYEKKDLKKIKIVNLKNKSKKGFSLRKIIAIRNQIKNVDIVISYMPSSNIYTTLSRLFLKKVYHLSCEVSTLNIAEGRYKRLISNISNLFSDHVICNSITHAKYIVQFPGMKKKVSTIWNGCENISFVEREKRKKDELQFIIVGRVAYPKNGYRFLQALKLFYEENEFVPKIRWIGRRDYSDKYNIEINNKIDEFLLQNDFLNKKFSFVDQKKNIEEEYSKADGLILPSIYEGLPFVICEAMLNGCPIIASNISDNEIILGEKFERGITFDPYSISAISDALNIFINLSCKKIKNMTKEARKFAENNFMIENMIDSYENIISKY